MLRLLFALLLFAFPARAQVFTTVPYVFVGGTPADASQVMADFYSIVTQGNAVSQHIQSQLTALGLPAHGGTLMIYFYLTSCPTGWTSVAIANNNNYFVRGLDIGANNDTTGSAFQLGRIESQSIVDHEHAQGPIVAAVGSTSGAAGGQGGVFASSVSFSAFGVPTGYPNSGRHGAVTYPNNVSLILCSKN